MASDLYNRVNNIPQIKNHSDQDRIKRELDILEDRDLLSDMFMLYKSVHDKIQFRGSKNKLNSLIAYVLGITDKAPDGEFVIEKRRTYGRAGFPDIDMDFDHSRRSEIMEYITNKYGQEQVGSIGTVQTLQTKASLRRVIKVLDPEGSIVFDSDGKKIKDDQSENFRLQNEILGTLPKDMRRADSTFIKNIDEAREEYAEFDRYMRTYPEVYEYSKEIEGDISAYGVHAAGILISPIPLSQIAPLHVTKRESDNGKIDRVVATQFSMKDVESLGLIKFDVLGLSTKTSIAAAIAMIKETTGDEIDMEKIPLDDQPTLDFLNEGHTDGCFQLENRGMQQTITQIGIDSFQDLMIAIAMYRPGPKDYIPLLAKRKRGAEIVQYHHPITKSITEHTYGVMVYQEQVMQVFMKLADLTATDGYYFMKGCAKKIKSIITESRDKFVKGARAKNIPKNVIKKIWTDMEKFGGYAFNAAHACAYAYESFLTAYLKCHYRLEFMCAKMSVEARRRKFDYVQKCENDCQNNFGITILNPDINRSKMGYTIVDEKTILRPLMIKGVGDKAAEDIIKHQPFKGPDIFYSLASSVGSAVNTKVIDALCSEGLFGKVKKSQLLKDFEEIKADKKRSRGRQKGDLFA